MQEKLTDTQTPASSRASSFFIENLLSKERDGQESVSDSSRGEASADLVSTGRIRNALPAPRVSSSTAPRESPLQWHRGGAALNFRALETPHSEYGYSCCTFWKLAIISPIGAKHAM